MGRDEAPVAKDQAKGQEDVLLVHARTETGDGYQVLRKRGERLEVGELRKTREGRPIHGELVRLKPREESDRLFDVEVVLPAPTEPVSPTKTGPAQVASRAYRDGWDATFGRGSN